MNFFKQFKLSFYGPDFYQAMSVAPKKDAIKYFIKLSSIVALVATILFALVFVPVVTIGLSKGNVEKLISHFPAELTLTVKSGKLSTNVTEPYVIPISILGDKAKSKKQNFVVIDTKVSPSMESFVRYDTNLLLTSEYAIVEKNSGEITVQRLKDIPDMSINRQAVASFAEKALPYVKLAVPVILLAVLVGAFFITVVGNLFFLLIVTLVVWIVGKIRKTGVGYGTYYKLGLYAITPVVVIGLFSPLFHVPWIADVAVYLILFFINTKLLKRSSV